MRPTSVEQIRLVNYRCFEDHTIALRDLSLIIGPNGSGKSAVVEALRLLSLAVNRHRGLKIQLAPVRDGFPRLTYGLAPSLRASRLSLRNVLRDSSLEVAQVEARFSTGATVHVYVRPEGSMFAVFTDEDGRPVKERAHLNQLRLPHIGVFAPPGELEPTEPDLSEDYVLACLDLPVGARHFRNQYRCLREEQPRLAELLKATMPELRLSTWPVWDSAQGDDDDDVSPPESGRLVLSAEYEGYECEVSELPSGLQVWLQTMWFLARMPGSAVVVLDEPETHLHPDLQHRLLRSVRGEAVQTVIATHSSELMADVEPRSLLLVDKQANSSSYADTLPQAQFFLDSVGTSLNLSLTRLQRSPKFLLVEGPDDQKALSLVHQLLFPDSAMPLATVPQLPMGGLSGLRIALEQAAAFRAHNPRQGVYCITDGDHYLPEEIDQWMASARQKGAYLHVWQRKELENYFMEPQAIRDFLAERISNDELPDMASLQARMLSLTDELTDTTSDLVLESLARRRRTCTPRSLSPIVRQVMAAKWTTLDQRMTIVPGKMLLRLVAAWVQDEFSISMSFVGLIRAHRKVPVEMSQIMAALENDAPFPLDSSGVFADVRTLFDS